MGVWMLMVTDLAVNLVQLGLAVVGVLALWGVVGLWWVRRRGR